MDLGINFVQNVNSYFFGRGGKNLLSSYLTELPTFQTNRVIYCVDEFFKSQQAITSEFPLRNRDDLIFISTSEEPTTQYIDDLMLSLTDRTSNKPCAIIGFGGGATMDIAKAVSNLFNNKGSAADYQGWDLLKNKGIHKVAIPTISGTGAEATRTCVMSNKRTGLKLGMNSRFTVFDHVIMDPDLPITVPNNQYFYTGMDAFIHCFESQAGRHRNPIGDAFCSQVINLCQRIFLDGEMKSPDNMERLMVASYLGGCAIATSYVGLVHPFSAGLSIVLGLPHCLANCIVMRAMENFYPKPYEDFWNMVDKQGVQIPRGVCSGLTEDQCIALYNATIIHEKPLGNALGDNFKDILTLDKTMQIFEEM